MQFVWTPLGLNTSCSCDEVIHAASDIFFFVKIPQINDCIIGIYYFPDLFSIIARTTSHIRKTSPPLVFHSIHDAITQNHNGKKISFMLILQCAQWLLRLPVMNEFGTLTFLYCFLGKQLNNKNSLSIAKYIIARRCQ